MWQPYIQIIKKDIIYIINTYKLLINQWSYYILHLLYIFWGVRVDFKKCELTRNAMPVDQKTCEFTTVWVELGTSWSARVITVFCFWQQVWTNYFHFEYFGVKLVPKMNTKYFHNEWIHVQPRSGILWVQCFFSPIGETNVSVLFLKYISMIVSTL